MGLCDFKLEEGKMVCQNCGQTMPFIPEFPEPFRYRANCTSGKKKGRKKKHVATVYINAVDKWIKAGKPKRTKKEIVHIYENVCKPCPHFRPGTLRDSCALCGCSLNKLKNGLVNKIAMATESCPDNPPRWKAKKGKKK